MTDDPFEAIIGNWAVKGYLRQMLTTQRIGNSLLFTGCDGIGKSLFAKALALAIIRTEDPLNQHWQKLERGIHPDFHELRPEGKMALHSIETMRRLSEMVYMPPSEARRQVFLIHDADRMLPTSANALLKTFEEPSAHSILILLSSQPQQLLPTVLSRCRKVTFAPIAEEEIARFLAHRFDCTQTDAEHLAALSQGSIGRAIHILQSSLLMNEALLHLLADGQVAHYKGLTERLASIYEPIETWKEQLEVQLREECKELASKDLSAALRESLQKEIEGIVALQVRGEVNGLLTTILAWYRDLELLRLGGDRSCLHHRGQVASLELALTRGLNRSMEKVEQAVAAAQLAFDRSSPLSHCLESLFLRLDYV